MGLDLRVQERFTEKFDEFAAWNMFLDVRRLVKTTFHSYGESGVLKARIQKVSMYEAIDLIRCDEKGRRHGCCSQ
jgi:ribosome-associated translation inhibitor RaiA